MMSANKIFIFFYVILSILILCMIFFGVILFCLIKEINILEELFNKILISLFQNKPIYNNSMQYFYDQQEENNKEMNRARRRYMVRKIPGYKNMLKNQSKKAVNDIETAFKKRWHQDDDDIFNDGGNPNDDEDTDDEIYNF